MTDFSSRKAARKVYFETHEKGWKTIRCFACNGTGRYDSGGSPKCGACEGTGKTRERPRTPVLLEL